MSVWLERWNQDLRYVAVVRDAGPAALVDMVRSAEDPELERTAVTIAERLIEQGRKEGLEKGMQKGIRKGVKEGVKRGVERGVKKGVKRGLEEGALEGRRALLLAQLSQRFGRLPGAIVARVRAAPMKRLDRLGLRLLDARSLDAIFRDDAGE